MFVAGSGVASIFFHRRVERQFNRIITITAPMLHAVGQMTASATKLMESITSRTLIYVARDAASPEQLANIAKEEGKFRDAHEELGHWLSQYAVLLEDEEERALASGILDVATQIFESNKELADLAKQGAPQEAFFDHQGRLEELEGQLLELFEEAKEDELQELADRGEAVRQAVQESTALSGLFFIIAALLSVGLGLVLTRSITGPMSVLLEGMGRIRSGALDTRVRVKAERELGELASGLNQMAQSLERNEQELRARHRELETLLYVTSHDLREPLRGIEQFSTILHDEYAAKLDPEAQDLLRRIVRATGRMRQLLDDVLALSRTRLITVPTTSIDASAVVQEVLDRLEETLRSSGAKVTVAHDLPALRVDKPWAVEALYSVVTNAVKFRREGQVPEIEIARYDAGGEIGIAVRDRGPGVAPEYAQRIFELFQRAVGRDIEGTGAGLAIVKAVAERHGGRAWVRAREGGGAEFIITFAPPQLRAGSDSGIA